MNPALLSAPPSSPHSLLFTSPPLRLRSTSLSGRRRFKIFSPRNSSDQSPSTTKLDIFGGNKDLTGIHPVMEKLSSPPIRLATSAVVLSGAIVAGYSLGLRFGRTTNAALGGGAVLGAAGGAAIYAVSAAAPQVAAISVHNYVAGCDDPGAVNKEDIESIAKKYGVSKQDETFNSELCDLYCCFLSYVLPSATEDLKGDEADKIIGFKNSLGIDDPDAAAMHIEIGRRIFRQRLETSDRDDDMEQRRAFQKLIYVSSLVFGEASSFLLPWKRVFKVTDAQVEIAIRENSKRLYANMLNSVGRDVEPKQLTSLREAQLKYRLPDEIAEDMFRERTRSLVEENISAALSILKSRTRAAGEQRRVVGELDRILAFNTSLISLREKHDADTFARGVGPVSLVGGEYDSDRKTDDLKLVYGGYVYGSLAGGCMEDNKLAALSQLSNVLGLGKREAEAIILDVTSKVYNRRLSEAVQDGELEMADSKAAFLQNLCDELHFDTEKASNIHESIYRTKLQKCVADEELDDEDVSALLRLRVMLCIPQQTVDTAHTEICGKLFGKALIKALKEAEKVGPENFGDDVRRVVKKAAHRLRLTREAALSIASKPVRKAFLYYIDLAQSAEEQTKCLEILKKMIAFNSLVVTKLVADIKGEASDSPSDESDKEELPKLVEVGAEKELADKEIKPFQTEITLREEDISESDRMDLYSMYLVHCLTSKVETGPLGGSDGSRERDSSEFLLLEHLGRILGLTKNEIMNVHRNLAGKSFMQQAEVMFSDGQLTNERIGQLKKLAEEVGLPPEYAQKVIKSVTKNYLAELIDEGQLSVQKIRQLKESGLIKLDTMIPGRQKVFEKSINKILSSGTGEINEEEVFEKIPSELNINAEKAKEVFLDLARSRLKDSLIQAVSQLRQRNDQGVVSCLNDMLVCEKFAPSEGLSWDVPEELADLFGVYARSNPEPWKLARLQSLLGISDSTAAALREIGDGIGLLSV